MTGGAIPVVMVVKMLVINIVQPLVQDSHYFAWARSSVKMLITHEPHGIF